MDNIAVAIGLVIVDLWPEAFNPYPAPRPLEPCGARRGAMEANSIVQYLGRIWGSGDVRSGGQTVARASYDFDGVTAPRGGVEGSGDLVLAPSDLKAVFGRVGVQLLSKRVDRPYRSRKSGEWLKTKCLRTGDFVIVGYQPDDRCRIANLKLGLEEADELRYAGVVGTGWTESIALVLKKRLDAIVVPEAPVAGIKANSRRDRLSPPDRDW